MDQAASQQSTAGVPQRAHRPGIAVDFAQRKPHETPLDVGVPGLHSVQKTAPLLLR